MVKNINIAVCIPTYERCEVVKDFLNTCAELYISYGLDIYYYDSSVSDKTLYVVSEWIKKSNNIYYIKMPSNMPSNIKVFNIFSGYGLKKQYDFIWVCGDAIQFSYTAINNLMSKIDKTYDIIQMNSRDFDKIGTREYTDYNEYLRDCAWELTLYGSAILNVNTILKDVDWKFYKKIYSKENLINFSHVGFYFTRICELEKFKALHISIPGKYFRSSFYKYKPGWQENMYFIFCETWVNTISSLPDCYIYKKEAISKHGKYVMLRSESDFISSRRKNILNIETFIKYYNKWSEVSPVKRNKIMIISIMPIWITKIIRKEKNKKNILKKLKKFCDKNKRVYIYGAGVYGSIYEFYLNSIAKESSGFAVTSSYNNPDRFSKGPIYLIDEIEMPQNAGFIVAMKENGDEVLKKLNEMGIHNVFYETDFISAFYQERGEI